MSIVDFIAGLLHDPAKLRAFLDDPVEALREAGLPDATPDQVNELLPLVAESIGPMESLVAQQNRELDDFCAPAADKEIGPAGADHAQVIVDSVRGGKWVSEGESDKALGPVDFAARSQSPRGTTNRMPTTPRR